MSKSGVIALVASITFIAGLTGGMLIGAARPGASRIEAKTGDTSRQQSSPQAPIGSTMESSVAEPSAKTAPNAADDSGRLAEELWELMSAHESRGLLTRGKSHRERLLELRPDMADFFIRKFKETSTATDTSQQRAMEMAISCGGPKAAAFVEELMQIPVDRLNSFRFRTAVAFMLSDGHLAPRPREFPVDESLLTRARLLQASTENEDRRLAAAVFGRADKNVALPLLKAMVQTDKDPYVRHMGLKQLGRIGDDATLGYLRANRDALAAEMFGQELQQQQPYKPGSGPVIAIGPTTHTRAIDDAIEHLEERLQAK
jgi:hypothetical protein